MSSYWFFPLYVLLNLTSSLFHMSLSLGDMIFKWLHWEFQLLTVMWLGKAGSERLFPSELAMGWYSSFQQSLYLLGFFKSNSVFHFPYRGKSSPGISSPGCPTAFFLSFYIFPHDFGDGSSLNSTQEMSQNTWILFWQIFHEKYCLDVYIIHKKCWRLGMFVNFNL